MKRSIAFLIIIVIICYTFADSDIFNFVHKDYDFVIRLSKGGTWYEELKKVSFFSFVFDRKGLGFEDSFLRILEDMKYKTGVQPTVVQDALSNDILFASKGAEVDFTTLISFDINYYLEFIKTITGSSFIVFETKYPAQLVKALSYLLSINVKNIQNNMFQLGESLFCTSNGKYLILAGSKQTLDMAIKTYTTPEMQLSRTNKDFDRLKAGVFFISGFAKPNTLKLNLPGGIGIEDSTASHLLITSSISAGSFTFTIEQKNTKQYTSSKNIDTIGQLPKVWNYYLSIPSSKSSIIIGSIEQWFSGVTSELQQLTNLVKNLSNSSTNTYVAGKLEVGEIVFIFENYSGKDFETNLSKLGAKYDSQKQEWVINLQNSKLYAFKSSNKVIVGTVDKNSFEKYEKTSKKLKDLPIYYDFSKMEAYDFKALMDLGDIIKSIIGFNITSKLLFWQYSIGYITYYKFVVS